MGVSDLEFVTIGGQDYLFVAAVADGAVSCLRISASGAPQLVDTLSLSATSGTFSVGHIDLIDVDGVLTLLPSARHDDDVVPYLIDGQGRIDAAVTQPSGGPNLSNLTLTHSVNIADKTYLYTVTRGVAGLTGYEMFAGNSFASPTIYNNSAFDFFGDISAFASVNIGAQTYLFTASAFDAGLNSFSINSSGGLQFIDSVANSDTSGFSLPQALETITVSGQTYLVMASAGTDSLTVYSVSSSGDLTEVDHLIDGVDTRFNDASSLASFSANGRSYILAAGSDDGLTLLEISAGGSLTVLSVLADDFDTTLDNITDIEVVQFGGEIHAFVSSGSENGFTQIQIDTSTIGSTFTGSAADETLNGSALDDVLDGLGGSDTINAGAGDDRITDGAGRDHLYGGAGADIFQFVADGTLDLIRDYQDGLDRIDLSLLTGINGINGLEIYPRSYGAVIIAAGEEIRIETADGSGLSLNDFSSLDFIF
jgi:Ca2+-binding RTX toxin-like protein